MVENEKIIKENIKLPDNIVSETDEVKIEEPDKEIIKEEIKIEEPENIKVAEVKFTEDQLQDINELLEADVSLEDAKKIVTGTYEEGDTKTINYEGKSEYEGDKEFFAKDGIDLDLIIKTKPEALKKSEAVLVDSVGMQVADNYISAKMLYEVNGYIADKDSEIKGDIRFKLGFGLDSPQFKLKRQIEAEIKSGEWQTRPARDRAKMLNEVQRVSENIMLNVNKRRLKLVKNRIRETMGPERAKFYLQDPFNLKQWIEENPALAANLGWGKWNPKFSELAKDPGVITDELRIVFVTKVRKPVDLLNFQQGFSNTVQTPQ